MSLMSPISMTSGDSPNENAVDYKPEFALKTVLVLLPEHGFHVTKVSVKRRRVVVFDQPICDLIVLRPCRRSHAVDELRHVRDNDCVLAKRQALAGYH